MLTEMNERPPYVEFHLHAVEDREATIENGHYTAKNVIFAHIMPFGGKDVVERVAEEWLDYLAKQTADKRFPSDWLKHFQKAFEGYKKGMETPRLGTPIEDFSLLSPAEILNLKTLKLFTVEDLAGATEDIIKRMPAGGRKLKQRAEDWLKSSKDYGKVTMELENIRTERDGLLERTKELEEKLAALTLEVQKLQKPANVKTS